MASSEATAVRRAIRRQGLAIGVSVIPFGVAFGIACSEASLSTGEAMGFSVLMFTGGSQFAAVRVLGDGGSAAAAIIAAVLLAMRSLAYGVVMAPVLTGSRWFRALASQLMIDESMAIGSAQIEPANQRYGYFAGGISIFVLWNASTFAGAALISSAGNLVATWGLDATIPAAFLALLWPRLADPTQRVVAIGGAAIAIGLVPVATAGLPIIAAAAAVALARVAPRRSAGAP